MPTKHELPKLFKKTSSGKIQENQIIVFDRGHEAAIKTFRGYSGGKIVEDAETLITSGVNIGKSNETTILEQALSEAKSRWNKKIDEGYFQSVEEVLRNIVILPMLAQKFTERKKHIKFPAICQVKLDGIRSLTVKLSDGSVSIKSRKGKEFPHLNHLREEAKSFPVGRYVDGELYSDELSFEQITGIVRRETLSAEDEKMLLKIKIRAYDCFIVEADEDFTLRHSTLCSTIAFTEHFTLVDNYLANNENDVVEFHNRFVTDGYEGVMIRNLKGAYELDKRSNNLQKFKVFQDGEFEIIGYDQGSGNEAGCIVFECKVSDGITFKCRPKGNAASKKELFLKGDELIGKFLTVRYFELSADRKVPRFPIGICLRDYE